MRQDRQQAQSRDIHDSVPRDAQVDSSLALLRESYTFITRRCERYGSDLFQTRLMLRKAICARGAAAAEMFYHPDRFTRRGAVPITTLMLLQGKGSVQTLDNQPHRRRKQMFMSLMTPAGIERLTQLTAEHWHTALSQWAQRDEVVLLEAARTILCRAVCQWAGVPLPEAQVAQRTRELGAMIDGAGRVGPRNWWGLWQRTRTERWAHTLVRQVRARELDAPDESALSVIAWHRDEAGELLDARIAAIELLNILRPTVAVARFVTFAALAMHEHPDALEKLRQDEEDYPHLFAQEVRRFYPFFPIVAGRALSAFDWQGHHFPKDTWVLLDLYGTNHDPRSWAQPNRFDPERFRHWDQNAYSLIPQGGGDIDFGHRCAGEWLTLELMKVALHMLANGMRYDVPEQDLRVRLTRLPAMPESRFRITHVRAA